MSGPARQPAETWTEPAAETLTLMEAIGIARRTVAALTDLPLDAVASSERHPEGGWRVVVDAIESPARLGDNDLIASHEVVLGADGALLGFSRLRRYRREEADPA